MCYVKMSKYLRKNRVIAIKSKYALMKIKFQIIDFERSTNHTLAKKFNRI